jgi:hypothetical protein
MYGRHGFMGKAASLFFDCDKICGPQFEKGLADLGKAALAATGSPPYDRRDHTTAVTHL